MSDRLRPTERIPADGSDGLNRQGFANWVTSSTAPAAVIAADKKIPSMTVVRKLIRQGRTTSVAAPNWFVH
jgi:hypothetical protein